MPSKAHREVRATKLHPVLYIRVDEAAVVRSCTQISVCSRVINPASHDKTIRCCGAEHGQVTRDGTLVRVLSNMWIFTRWVWVWVYFYTCDLNLNLIRAELILCAGFIFHPRALEIWKKSETWKKPEKTEKTRNPKKHWNKLERNLLFTKPDGHPKSDGFKFRC
jgi:hypothetical protein